MPANVMKVQTSGLKVANGATFWNCQRIGQTHIYFIRSQKHWKTPKFKFSTTASHTNTWCSFGTLSEKTGLCGNLPTWPPKVFPKVGQTYLGHIDPSVIKYKHQCWEFQIKKCKCWSHIFERNIYANFSFITIHIPLISELQYVSCLVLVSFTNPLSSEAGNLSPEAHSCYSEFHRLDYPFI